MNTSSQDRAQATCSALEVVRKLLVALADEQGLSMLRMELEDALDDEVSDLEREMDALRGKISAAFKKGQAFLSSAEQCPVKVPRMNTDPQLSTGEQP